MVNIMPNCPKCGSNKYVSLDRGCTRTCATLGSVAGVGSAATFGGFVGSFLCPGVGTAVGAGVGGLVGGLIGGAVTGACVGSALDDLCDEFVCKVCGVKFQNRLPPMRGAVVKVNLAAGMACHTGICLNASEIAEVTNVGGMAIVRCVSPREFLRGPDGDFPLRTGVYIEVAGRATENGWVTIWNPEIATRAEGMIGINRGKYDLTHNNCHMFTRYCITGRNTSDSVRPEWFQRDIEVTFKSEYNLDDVTFISTGFTCNSGEGFVNYVRVQDEPRYTGANKLENRFEDDERIDILQDQLLELTQRVHNLLVSGNGRFVKSAGNVREFWSIQHDVLNCLRMVKTATGEFGVKMDRQFHGLRKGPNKPAEAYHEKLCDVNECLNDAWDKCYAVRSSILSGGGT